MTENKEDIAMFISFCIEQYKASKGISGEEAMRLFDRFGVLEYLQECFDVLHTQGHQWLMADIDEFIANRKKEGLT